MRVFIAILVVGALSGCALTPGKFSTDPLPEIDEYTVPKLETLTQVKGDIQSPYDYVCRFNVNRRYGFFMWGANKISSGGLLNNGIIISAGHNFYSPWYTHANSVYVECGVGTKPHQTPLYSETNVFKKDQKVISSLYGWNTFGEDIAFIKVCNENSSVPEKSPFILATKKDMADIKADFNDYIKNGNAEKAIVLYVAGYPGDKPYTGSKLVHLKTVIEEISGNVASYTYKNTYRGMSGSPVWIEKDEKKLIVGTHVKNGGAYLLSDYMLDEYEKWRAKLGSDAKTPCIK